MTETTFDAVIGVLFVAGVVLAALYFFLKKRMGIDVQMEFYASLAEFTGFWYDRKEHRARLADRRRSS